MKNQRISIFTFCSLLNQFETCKNVRIWFSLIIERKTDTISNVNINLRGDKSEKTFQIFIVNAFENQTYVQAYVGHQMSYGCESEFK